MTKIRIYELAKELNESSKELVKYSQNLGIDVKSHMSVINEKDADKIKKYLLDKKSDNKHIDKTTSSNIKENSATKESKSTSSAKHINNSKIKINVNAIRKPKTNLNGNKTINKSKNTKNQNSKNATPSKPKLFDAKAQANVLKRKQNQEDYELNYKKGLNTRKEEKPKKVEVIKPKKELKVQKNPQPSINKTNLSNNHNSNPQNNNYKNNSENKKNYQHKEFTKPNLKKESQSGEFWKNTSSKKKSGKQQIDNIFNNNRSNRKNKKQKSVVQQKTVRKDKPLPKVLKFTEGMNAQEIGKILHREPTEIVKKLFMLGIMINQNQSLDDDTIELLATDYNIESQKIVPEDVSDLDKYFELTDYDKEHMKKRPPVVTIMGHVDHGKTTLLDRLRHTHVTDEEAGGITQHIGAYQVNINNRLITFLDTPGHEAFTNMRARGADITDIIILVVASDDGVMPQTIEAINHAKSANVPIIVAVNKIDKPGANPNHVMEQLTEYQLIPESWGGDTIFVQISAKTGKNIDELLEMVNLEADVLELKANPDRNAIGAVIEARLDKGRGPVATLLVQEGTLHVGDPLVVGHTFGRVRSMNNDHGKKVKQALPSTPVEITGLNSVPQSADKFVVFNDEKTSRQVGEERAKLAEMSERQKSHHITIDNLFDSMNEGDLKEVAVIIKADVQGSVEALKQSLEKIKVKGVKVNVIHEAVGAINESDVSLAAAGNAIIIGFNVRPTAQAQQEANSENVDIRLHSVIYKAIEEIESSMKGMLEPVYEEKVTGMLTVHELFKVSHLGTIAGSFVDSGYIRKDSGVRLIRQGIVIYEGKLASLKRYKDDVKEVKAGNDCGVMIEKFNDIKVDDQIEAFIMEEVAVD